MTVRGCGFSVLVALLLVYGVGRWVASDPLDAIGKSMWFFSGGSSAWESTAVRIVSVQRTCTPIGKSYIHPDLQPISAAEAQALCDSTESRRAEALKLVKRQVAGQPCQGQGGPACMDNERARFSGNAEFAVEGVDGKDAGYRTTFESVYPEASFLILAPGDIVEVQRCLKEPSIVRLKDGMSQQRRCRKLKVRPPAPGPARSGASSPPPS